MIRLFSKTKKLSCFSFAQKEKQLKTQESAKDVETTNNNINELKKKIIKE